VLHCLLILAIFPQPRKISRVWIRELKN